MPADLVSRLSARAGARPLAALLAATALLGGCYVLPMDPHTGQPVLPRGVAADGAPAPATAAPLILPGAPAATTLQARLYPLNEAANRSGMLAAQVSDSRSGRGQFALSYNGQLMQGEATRVDNGYAGFGRIHDEVLGRSTRTYTGRRGIANAYGTQGVSAQCEYTLTGPSMGTGVCLFSDGAKYQMHF